MTPALRRVLILLALLPQLLVLGLGRGAVFCVAPGGHVKIEIAAGACCAEAPTASPEAALGRGWGSGGDCGACRDLRIVIDPRVSRAPDGMDPDAGTPPAPVEEAAAFGRAQPALVGHRGSRGELEPRHLQHLRSVLQRC